MKKYIIILLGIAILAFAIGFGSLKIMSGPVDKNDDKEILITIEHGSSTDQIADVLKEKGTIKSKLVFKIKSKLSGYDGKYLAGEYAVKKSMSMAEQMKIIVEGKSVAQVFTVTAGTNLDKIAQMLEKNDIVTAEEFLYEAANGDFEYDFLNDIPKGTLRLEGFLYPDTYQVSLDADAHEVIDVMLKQFDKKFNEKYRKRAEELGLNIRETITLASIVEREAKTPEDMENVASVIYNRLEINMPLQMDSILAYITGEEKIKASYEDTQVASDYNPYQNYGLPPGPICSPGEKAIESALYPPDTDYLYFVATEKLDGTNVFSETYEDFLKNKEKFDKAYKEYIKENPDKR